MRTIVHLNKIIEEYKEKSLAFYAHCDFKKEESNLLKRKECNDKEQYLTDEFKRKVKIHLLEDQDKMNAVFKVAVDSILTVLVNSWDLKDKVNCSAEVEVSPYIMQLKEDLKEDLNRLELSYQYELDSSKTAMRLVYLKNNEKFKELDTTNCITRSMVYFLYRELKEVTADDGLGLHLCGSKYQLNRIECVNVGMGEHNVFFYVVDLDTNEEKKLKYEGQYDLYFFNL